MAQRGYHYDPAIWHVVMCSIYSDYAEVAKKYGLSGNAEFFADMAARRQRRRRGQGGSVLLLRSNALRAREPPEVNSSGVLSSDVLRKTAIALLG